MGMGVDEWECKLFREVLTEPSRRGTRRSLFFKHHCPGGLDPSFLVTRDWIKWTFTLLSSHHQNPLLLHHLSHLAAFHGYLDVLKWLKRHWDPVLREMRRSPFPAMYASYGEHLEVLQWLRSQGCPWDEKACCGAAYKGSLEMLVWLRGEGCPWNEETCKGAAAGGHLEVLQWARSQGCPWDKETCHEAAKAGNLKMLKWVRNQDPPCPWDAQTSWAAAKGGHLDVLQWATSQGCPWNKKTCISAATQGHLETTLGSKWR